MTATIIEDSPYYVDEGGDLRFNYHPGQRQAMDSQARFPLVLSGTQGGKTILGPWWLFREMCRKGAGDYLVVAPSYPLMQRKALPEFRRLFKIRLDLGEYYATDRIFELSSYGEKVLFGEEQPEENKTQVFFGHAQDPDSLESATAKAAWLDEAGQKKFKYGSWQAVRRRLSIHQGRALLTTTPYVLGWLKNELHDKAEERDDIDLIQFKSTDNPAFPAEEYKQQQEQLPRWKFNMMYRGIFERPAGMIYDCFTDENKVARFSIPNSWKRFAGVDFGGVNTAACYIAKKPDKEEYYLYDTYKKGGRTAQQHAEKMKEGDRELRAVGGSWSEDQWRDEFKAGGLHIHKPPIKDVEVGINRVYSLFKQNKLYVFDDLTAMIDDIESYSRKLDDQGEPTEKIEDKQAFHFADSLRYIATYLEQQKSQSLSPRKVNI